MPLPLSPPSVAEKANKKEDRLAAAAGERKKVRERMQVCVGNCRVFHLEPIATKNSGTLLRFFFAFKGRGYFLTTGSMNCHIFQNRP